MQDKQCSHLHLVHWEYRSLTFPGIVKMMIILMMMKMMMMMMIDIIITIMMIHHSLVVFLHYHLCELEKSYNHIQTLTKIIQMQPKCYPETLTLQLLSGKNCTIIMGDKGRNICSKLHKIMKYFNLEQQHMSPSRVLRILDLFCKK